MLVEHQNVIPIPKFWWNIIFSCQKLKSWIPRCVGWTQEMLVGSQNDNPILGQITKYCLDINMLYDY